MADLSVLHARVIDSPDDEDARLAYADAVAPADPARAELIRVQIALARDRRDHPRWTNRGEYLCADAVARDLLADPRRQERDGWLGREHALLAEHAAAWSANVRPLVDAAAFRRGFVEWVRLDAAAFLARAADLYRRAPVLHLDLTGVPAVAADLFASPHLARVRSLGCARDGLGDAEAALLARSPHLAGLRWLDLSGNRVGERGVEALAASDMLPRLGYVGLGGNAAADPTPRFADEYDSESPRAAELKARHGHRTWLDFTPRATWPPDRDALP